MTTQLERDEARRSKDPYPWKALPQVHEQRIAAVVDLTALQAVEGYVWCDKHGEVHTDTLNPYGYSDNADNDFCTDNDHRALYMEPDDIMGHPTSDEDPGSFVPESGLTPGGSCRVVPSPVRSNPVPLTVRRHTDESRKIWRNNLMDALPADLSNEDRSKIADALLETAIATGNELRRKRLIDKLVATSAEMSSWDAQDIPPFADWSDLMDDAAEEIRSLL